MTALKKYFLQTKFIAIAVIVLTSLAGHSQEKEKLLSVDSSKTTTIKVDSTKNGVEKKIRVYSPRKAAIRSAILPGLGQIYNKKYWKLPIVYAGLGISGGVFIFNLSSYKNTRFAYQAKYKAALPVYDPLNPTPGPFRDSTDYFKIKSPLERYSLETLRYYRDSYRRDIDYSVLVFVILWGLNVVDATVDAHLKAFDVSPDLSLKIKPGHSQLSGTTGLSLVLTIGKNINPKPGLIQSRF